MNHEVSNRPFIDLCRYLESTGVPDGGLDMKAINEEIAPEQVTRDYLMNSRNFVSWKVFATYMQQVENYFPDQDSICRFVQWSLGGKALYLHPFLTILKHVITPAGQLAIMDWSGRFMFPGIPMTLQKVDGRNYIVELKLKPDMVPSPLFFRIVQANLELMPTLIGAISSVVQLEIDGTFGRFKVHLAPGRAFWQRLGTLFLAVFRSRRLLRDLQERDLQIHTAHSDLVRAQQDLARQVEARTAELAESRNFLSTLMEGIPDRILTINPDKTIGYINHLAEMYRCEDVIGHSCLEFVPPGFREQYGALLDRVFRTGVGETMELPITDTSVALVRIVPLRQGDRVDRVIAVSSDITRTKAIETQLIQAKDLAVSASRAKSAFLANVSHEIRTPLTAIVGYADMLTRSETLSAEDRESVIRIHRNSDHLLALINDILDISKIESGAVELSLIAFRPRDLLRDVIETFQVLAARRGIRLNLAEVTLPSVMDEVVGDATRIRQVLINLVGNAVKFTTEGHVSVRMTGVPAAGGEGRHKLVVTVEDTGRGVAPEFSEKIFQPFEQGDMSLSRNFGGTGLGLFLSRQISRLMGGDVRLQRSEPGRGSVFVAEIIVEGAAAMQQNPLARSQRLLIRPGHAGTGQVLVVEDHSDIAELLRIYLEGAGYKVSVAPDGESGFLSALQQQPDLVIMDLQLPRKDGYMTTAELRSAGYTGLVMALSANARPEERLRCLESGFDEFMSKPVDRAQFLTRIQAILGGPAALS